VPDRSRVEVIGHGGAGAYYPGNSRSALEAAIRFGVDRIECDIQCSQNGDLVLVHDDRVPLPSGGKRRVAHLTTAELRVVLPGLLTLDEAAELTATRVPLMLDIKRSGYDEAVIEAIARHRFDRACSLSTTYLSTLVKLGRRFPAMRRGLSTGHLSTGVPGPLAQRLATWGLRAGSPVVLPRVLALAGATEAMLHYRIVSKKLVDSIHASGRLVNTWTVDRESDAARLHELGVDGIISNRPDAILALFRS